MPKSITFDEILVSRPHKINIKGGNTKDCDELLNNVDTEIGLFPCSHFKIALDNLYDGIYIADKDGKTIYVNNAYLKMTNLKYEDVIDQYVDELLERGVYKNAVTPEVIKYKKQINSIGKAINGVDMLITGKPIFDRNQNLEYVIVIDRDISDLLLMKNKLELTEKRIEAVEKDYFEKTKVIEHLKKQYLESSIIGVSQEMHKVIKMAQKIAPLDVTVLITGESGVGKEVVANEIYQNSLRKCKSFIKVNCAAIPANLMEAELFGYEKGAFTGAVKDKPGLFQLAHEGTLFLDEIGEVPIELQAKLLRAIQQQEITPVGGTKVHKLDVRFIAATNNDLLKRCQEGKFREDLYYRLNVVPIQIPPLRQRKRDIKELSDYFLKKYNKKYRKNILIDQGGQSLLHEYEWPGNVRELQNIIERLVIVSDDESIIDNTQISYIIYPHSSLEPIYSKEIGLKEILEKFERQILLDVLKETGSTRKAAKRLKIDQSTVVKKAKKLGIKFDEKNHHE